MNFNHREESIVNATRRNRGLIHYQRLGGENTLGKKN